MRQPWCGEGTDGVLLPYCWGGNPALQRSGLSFWVSSALVLGQRESATEQNSLFRIKPKEETDKGLVSPGKGRWKFPSGEGALGPEAWIAP